MVVPCKDEITLEVYMNEEAMDHVVFAVARKKVAKAMQKEEGDLQRFVVVLGQWPSGRKWVAEDLAVVSESKEAVGDLITEAMLDQVERSVSYDQHRPKTPPPDLPSLLLHGRIIYIGMPLVAAVTELVVAELMYLQWVDPKEPIYMYINSTARDDDETIEAYPKTTTILVRNHGVYIWGDSWINAKTQLKVGSGEDFFPRNGRCNFNNKRLVDPAKIERSMEKEESLRIWNCHLVHCPSMPLVMTPVQSLIVATLTARALSQYAPSDDAKRGGKASHMFEHGAYTLAHRLGTPNKPPSTLLNAWTWVLHMGLSSNLRYQSLNEIEFLLEKGLPSFVFKNSVV